MNWGGKIAGAALGLVAGGPVGILVGLAIGHQFDRGWRGVNARPIEALDARRHAMLFAATFQVMGYLAKLDGRVSEAEIRAARGVMHGMRLTPEEIREAISHFSVGKAESFSLPRVLDQLRETIGDERALCRSFVELQLRMLTQAGSFNSAERRALWEIASALGVSRVALAQMEASLASWRQGGPPVDARRDLAGAYELLGITAQASDEELKVAYRRLMNRHHPDKLAARGDPASEQEAAKEKTRAVRAAYERVCRQRGLR